MKKKYKYIYIMQRMSGQYIRKCAEKASGIWYSMYRNNKTSHVFCHCLFIVNYSICLQIGLMISIREG